MTSRAAPCALAIPIVYIQNRSLRSSCAKELFSSKMILQIGKFDVADEMQLMSPWSYCFVYYSIRSGIAVHYTRRVNEW